MVKLIASIEIEVDDDASDFDTHRFYEQFKEFANKMLGNTSWEYMTYIEVKKWDD